MKFQKCFPGLMVLITLGVHCNSQAARITNKDFPSTAQAAASTFGEEPKLIAPIRYGDGLIKVTRTDITLDPNTGESHVTASVICSVSSKVSVYDFRGVSAPWYIEPERIKCTDTIDGETVQVTIMPILDLTKGTFADPNMPTKGFNVFAWTMPSAKLSLPEIPRQTSYTTDLAQTFFGAYGFSAQAVTCQSGSERQAIDPLPPKKAAKCKVFNPIAYSFQMEVQDNKQ